MTKDELVHAVRLIMQDDKKVHFLMGSVTLPWVVRMAAEKAFIDEITGPPVEVVREAMKMLRQTDAPEHFVFEEQKNGNSKS